MGRLLLSNCPDGWEYICSTANPVFSFFSPPPYLFFLLQLTVNMWAGCSDGTETWASVWSGRWTSSGPPNSSRASWAPGRNIRIKATTSPKVGNWLILSFLACNWTWGGSVKGDSLSLLLLSYIITEPRSLLGWRKQSAADLSNVKNEWLLFVSPKKKKKMQSINKIRHLHQVHLSRGFHRKKKISIMCFNWISFSERLWWKRQHLESLIFEI